MKSLDLPEAFRRLDNKIQGTGVEVFLIDSPEPLRTQHEQQLNLHALLIVLDGSVIASCNTAREWIKKEEAIMIKKNSIVQFIVSPDHLNVFRCLIIFFDEPSLRYALLPFELEPNNNGRSFLKIPLNEKLNIFTESILLYYNANKEKANWTALLQNKLRELLWIFFHTELREEAKHFFRSAE